MQLKNGFILHNVGGEHMAVATGDILQDFYGFVRNNETAAYIFELLQKETTQEKIVEALCERYEDADKIVVEQDVANIIAQMKARGFLQE